MTRTRLFFLFMSLFLFVVPVSAQSPIPITNLLEVEIIHAGYGGMYRSDEWFPVQVRIINRGVNFSGRVVVRPETTAGVNSTYSVAIPELASPLSPANPTIAQTTLYVIGHERNLNLYVELVNQDGVTVASDQTPVRNIPPADRIYTVISPRMINLTAISTANATGLQANWTLANIPDHAGAMTSINGMIFDEVNTSALTPAQAEALHLWILNGGHLIIMGDSDISGLPEGLSPFISEGVTTNTDFTWLPQFTKRTEMPSGEILLNTGTVTGYTWLQTVDEIPLIARHEIGHGTVDYLTFSPSLAPLNQVRGIGGLYFGLFSTTQQVPPWAYGFFDWGTARSALEIMPGLTLLPSVWSLLAFLGAYVIVVGPINYLVLSWINRRDYAWVTIPLSIALFSFLAYTLGFELRGDVVTLNRLNVVQTWTDSDKAQVDQLTGLLSPQRGSYNLSFNDGLLRPLGEHFTALNLDRQSSVEISQSNQFEARDFTVDASFMMGFVSQGTIPRPSINGAVTVNVEADGNKSLRGYIQNDLPFTLSNPTIITAGITHSLGDELTSGLTDFSITSPEPLFIESAVASNQEHIYNRHIVTHNPLIRSRQSSYVFSNELAFNPLNESDQLIDIQTNTQRNYLAQALLQDQYTTTGRGNRVFLLGWGDQAIFDPTVNVNQQQIRELNTTLYIIELEADYSTQETRTITQDQFMWTAFERGESSLTAPVLLDPTFSVPLAFRFTPQPNAILDRVDQLTIILDRATLNVWRGAIEVWNWDTQAWERFETVDDEYIVIDEPAPYIGFLNIVDIRTIPPDVNQAHDGYGTPVLNRIGIMQHGS